MELYLKALFAQTTNPVIPQNWTDRFNAFISKYKNRRPDLVDGRRMRQMIESKMSILEWNQLVELAKTDQQAAITVNTFMARCVNPPPPYKRKTQKPRMRSFWTGQTPKPGSHRSPN